MEDRQSVGDERNSGRNRRTGWAEASNDPNVGPDLDIPAGLSDAESVEAAARRMLNAPSDLPVGGLAIAGLATALQSVEHLVPGAAMIAARIGAQKEAICVGAAAGATLLALTRRKSRHLMYDLAIEVGNVVGRGYHPDAVVLQIFALGCLRVLLSGREPSATSIAMLKVALLSPSRERAKAWSGRARARAFTRATRDLARAVTDHPGVAARFGMGQATRRVVIANDPVSIFNRAFRRRVDNLTDFATLDAVAGAGGYGTLSAPGLLHAGRELLERALAGDKGAFLVCLEVRTHLTSDIVLALPLQLEDSPPHDAMAWIDVRGGAYCCKLHRLIERAARPEKGTEHLYEVTSQVVRVRLSPPLHRLLKQYLAETHGTATDVRALLGDVAHHPRSAVAGDGVYRTTARRLQESLPALLLQAGHYRWPVALATNSQFLVSRGRPSYGACRSDVVDVVVAAGDRLLGWPTAEVDSESGLIGSFTVPRSTSVAQALNFLANRADKTALDGDADALVRHLNMHAEWLSMLLALGFALRRWLRYALKARDLRGGRQASINDKQVHPLEGPAVPICRLLRGALARWYGLCEEVIAALRTLKEPRSTALADRIEARIRDLSSEETVFFIDAADRLQPVGWHTWSEALPRAMRLQGNFARQYWPLQLMSRGIEQLGIDLLMRHQLEDLHPGSSHSVRQIAAAMERLLVAMDDSLAALGLVVPAALRSSSK